MDKEDAEFFAGEMEEFLDIPSMLCEGIEKKLIEGNFKEVCEFILRRRRSIKFRNTEVPSQSDNQSQGE